MVLDQKPQPTKSCGSILLGILARCRDTEKMSLWRQKMELSDFKSWSDRLLGVYDELKNGVLSGMGGGACDPEIMEQAMAKCAGDLRRSAFEIGRKQGQRMAFVPQPPTVVSSHQLNRRFSSMEEVLDAIRASGVTFEEYDFNVANYPFRPQMMVGNAVVVGLDVKGSFDREPFPDDLISLFRMRGYEPLTYEDALRHLAENPRSKEEGRIRVYLHRMCNGSSGFSVGEYRGDRVFVRFANIEKSQWSQENCIFYARER